jgi:peroxiredoxin
VESNQGERRKIELMTAARDCLFLLVALMAAGTAVAGSDVSQGGVYGADANVRKLPGAEIASKKQLSRAGEEPGRMSLSLPGLDGVSHSLADWKGKVIILNFWASWCSPCLYEIRDFVAYQAQYNTRGLQIIGVGLDEENKLRNVQRTLEINYPVLVADLKKNPDLMKTWGNDSGVVPFSVVIDRNGQVIFVQHGQIDHETFIENILPLLDKV